MTDQNYHFSPVQSGLFSQHTGQPHHGQPMPMVPAPYNIMPPTGPYMQIYSQFDPSMQQHMPVNIQRFVPLYPNFPFQPMQGSAPILLPTGASPATGAPGNQAPMIHQGQHPHAVPHNPVYPPHMHYPGNGATPFLVPHQPPLPQQNATPSQPPPANSQPHPPVQSGNLTGTPTPATVPTSTATALPHKRSKNILTIVDPNTGRNVIADSVEESAAQAPPADATMPTGTEAKEADTGATKLNGDHRNGIGADHIIKKTGDNLLVEESQPVKDSTIPEHTSPVIVSVKEEKQSNGTCLSPASTVPLVSPGSAHTGASTNGEESDNELLTSDTVAMSPSPGSDAPAGVYRYTHEDLLRLRKSELSLRRPSTLPHIESVTLDEPVKVSEDFSVLAQKQQKKGKVAYGHQPTRPMPNKGPHGQKFQRPSPTAPEHRIINIPKQEVSFREAASTFKHHYHRAVETSDESELLRKKINGLLNKLTPENFPKIYEKILCLEITSMENLITLCDLIFEKATREKTYASTFAKLCWQLKDKFPVPDDKDLQRKVTFRGPVIRHCQSQFETPFVEYMKREEEELDAEIAAEEDERTRNLLSGNKEEILKRKEEQYYGNMRFIGELIKVGVIKPVVMGYCSNQLMIKSASALDCLCELYTTVGELVEAHGSHNIEPVFKFIADMSKDLSVDSRLRFKLLELLELRERNWKKRELQEKLQSGPMTLSQMREKSMREQAENEENIRNMQKTARSASQRLPGGGGGGGGNYAFRVPGPPTPFIKKLDTASLVMSPTPDISKMSFGPSSSKNWAEGSKSQQQHHSKKADNDGWQDTKFSKNNRVARQVSHTAAMNRSESPIITSNRFDRQHSLQPKVSSTSNSGRSTPVCHFQTPQTHHMHQPQSPFASSDTAAPQLNLQAMATPPRGSISSIPNEAASNASASQQDLVRLDPGQLERRVECNLQEFISTSIFDKASYELHRDDYAFYVETMVMYAFEKCDATKSKAGEFMERLLREDVLSLNGVVCGLQSLFSNSPDLLSDYPNFWQYMAVILERFIAEEHSNISFFSQLKTPGVDAMKFSLMLARALHIASKRLGHVTVGKVFRDSLSWRDFLPDAAELDAFLKKNELEFTVAPLMRVDSMTPEKLTEALFKMRHQDNEEIFDYIEEHMNPMKCGDFVNGIATFVFTCATPGGKYNSEAFLKRLPILEKWVKALKAQDEEARELTDRRILTAIQQVTKVENPRQTRETLVDDLETHGIIDSGTAAEFKRQLFTS